jgi:arylsulfatase A-like enzyme
VQKARDASLGCNAPHQLDGGSSHSPSPGIFQQRNLRKFTTLPEKMPSIMRHLIVLFCPLLFACGNTPAVPEEGDATLPNIIFVLADDLGYGDLGSYGQDSIPTPHLDKMARLGLRFTQFYAGSTVCAPSRAALMTGKHPGRTSVRGNQPQPQMIADAEITLAEALNAADYHSGFIGKWGMGLPQPPNDPARNGFDYAFGYTDMVHAHNFYPTFLVRNGEEITQPGNQSRTDLDWASHYRKAAPMGGGVAQEKVTYAPTEFDRETLDFIDRNQNRPFFLYLAPNTPHANNEAGDLTGDGMEVQTVKIEDEWVYDYGPFAEKSWPDPEKGFARMVHNLDATMGMILERLETLGLADRTLIFFTSDNGPHQEGQHQMEFFDSNGSLRGKKRDLYEGGIRVPMIAYWPGEVPAGVTDQPFAFWDVMPTLCAVAGVPTPAETDGISMLPLLTGNTDDQPQHDHLYFEFYEQGGKQAVRQGDWKLVRLNLHNEQPIVNELYHLAEDPGEQRDLSGAYPDRVENLIRIAEEEHRPFPGISLYRVGD